MYIEERPPMPMRPPPRPLPREVPGAPEAAPPVGTGEAVHQALRDARDVVDRLKAQGVADQRRIEALEGEVTRLTDQARTHEGIRVRLEDDVQDQKDRVRQAEANLRNALQDLTRWHNEAVGAQARIDTLEDRIARMPPPAAVGQGLGVCEAFLDATGTKAQWLSTLAFERTEVGMTC